MPEVARKDMTDTVASPDGSGVCSADPSTQATDEGSSRVFIGGIGVVRQGDKMKLHLYDGPCDTPHQPVLTTYSTNVYVEGRGIGRKGDAYGGDHIITTGSTRVYSG
jgi:uncharacterized Zn-binding protein involved in type VI secretion